MSGTASFGLRDDAAEHAAFGYRRAIEPPQNTRNALNYTAKTADFIVSTKIAPLQATSPGKIGISRNP
jgi:hypothetical protein